MSEYQLSCDRPVFRESVTVPGPDFYIDVYTESQRRKEEEDIFRAGDEFVPSDSTGRTCRGCGRPLKDWTRLSCNRECAKLVTGKGTK